MKLLQRFATAGLVLASSMNLHADQGAPPTSAKGLDRLLSIIKPQPGESPWREIAWLTDVTTARALAVLEDKPIAIFTAADGSPLGRT